jgi:hypothetical protein
MNGRIKRPLTKVYVAISYKSYAISSMSMEDFIAIYELFFLTGCEF